MYIGHETRIEYLPDILKNGLLVSSQVKHKGQGQGSRHQRLVDSPVLKPEYLSLDAVSVDAVYFRVFRNKADVQPKYGGDCIILLNPKSLEKFVWHFNSTENYGFILDGQSLFSGDDGTTVYKLEDINPDCTDGELVILNNVDKCYFKKILYFNNLCKQNV